MYLQEARHAEDSSDFLRVVGMGRCLPTCSPPPPPNRSQSAFLRFPAPYPIALSSPCIFLLNYSVPISYYHTKIPAWGQNGQGPSCKQKTLSRLFQLATPLPTLPILWMCHCHDNPVSMLTPAVSYSINLIVCTATAAYIGNILHIISSFYINVWK